MLSHRQQPRLLLAMLAGCGGGSNAPDARPVDDGASVDGGIADGGIADAAAGDAAFDETPNYVFVTAMSFNGNLGGIAGADAICNGAAGLTGLPGQYVAWLSTDDVDAIDRLADARGWVRPDGQPFADRPSDIADSKVFYPPVVTEMMTFPSVRQVWTATAANGRFKADAGDCDGWTSTDSELNGGTGTSVGGSVAFTDDRGATARCDETRSLLCFGIDYRAQVKPQEVGRIAFTTRATIAGWAGLDNMDGLCDSEASEAGLEGTFLALVSLAGSPGPERFNGSGATWIRPDGVRLYATAEDLGNNGPIMAPVALTADAQTYLDADVWTGAVDSWSQVGSNCDDWMSTDGVAGIGRSGLTETYEVFVGAADCPESKALYCLQN